jgi:hypothetical protein
MVFIPVSTSCNKCFLSLSKLIAIGSDTGCHAGRTQTSETLIFLLLKKKKDKVKISLLWAMGAPRVARG